MRSVNWSANSEKLSVWHRKVSHPRVQYARYGYAPKVCQLSLLIGDCVLSSTVY